MVTRRDSLISCRSSIRWTLATRFASQSFRTCCRPTRRRERTSLPESRIHAVAWPSPGYLEGASSAALPSRNGRGRAPEPVVVQQVSTRRARGLGASELVEVRSAQLLPERVRRSSSLGLEISSTAALSGLYETRRVDRGVRSALPERHRPPSAGGSRGEVAAHRRPVTTTTGGATVMSRIRGPRRAPCSRPVKPKPTQLHGAEDATAPSRASAGRAPQTKHSVVVCVSSAVSHNATHQGLSTLKRRACSDTSGQDSNGSKRAIVAFHHPWDPKNLIAKDRTLRES